MNAESESTTPKGKIVSLPFLLIAVVLVVGGYPAGKWVMKQVMIQQEQGKASSEAIAPPADLERTGIGAMSQQNRAMGGAPPSEAGGGGGGGFDPDAIFARRDADDNGKLEGEEISERMQGRMEEMDTDKDGAISKEEFLAAIGNRGGRGGGGEGGERQRRPESDDSDEDADNDDDQ